MKAPDISDRKMAGEAVDSADEAGLVVAIWPGGDEPMNERDGPAGVTSTDGPHEPRAEGSQRQSSRVRRRSASQVADDEKARIKCMLDVERESVEWLWWGRLPIGKLTILDGDPGLGKSTLTAEIAARVSRGEALPFAPLLAPKPKPRGVVFLSYEDGLGDTLRPRLEAAGAELSKIHAYDPADEHGPPPLLDDLARIEDDARRVDASLIVIDPLMAALGASCDANKDQEVRRVLAGLAALAARVGAAVLMVRHLNKRADGSALYRGGGSIGIIGASRVGLVLARDPGDSDPRSSRRVLAVSKCNLGAMAPSLSLELGAKGEVAVIAWGHEVELGADDLVSAAPREPSASKVDLAAEWLRDLLSAGPVASKDVDRAAREAGFSEAAIKRARQSLGVRSEKVGASWFLRLPDQGAHASHLARVEPLEPLEPLEGARGGEGAQEDQGAQGSHVGHDELLPFE